MRGGERSETAFGGCSEQVDPPRLRIYLASRVHSPLKAVALRATPLIPRRMRSIRPRPAPPATFPQGGRGASFCSALRHAAAILGNGSGAAPVPAVRNPGTLLARLRAGPATR